MKFICRFFGCKMYKIKPFYNFYTGEVKVFAVDSKECTRCGKE